MGLEMNAAASLGPKVGGPATVAPPRAPVGRRPQPGGRAGGAVQRSVASGGWDLKKCPKGGPIPFDPEEAVNAADFTDSVYVNTSAEQGKTRQAYTYVQVRDASDAVWRVCVVGHIHPTKFGAVAGNAFIPGWKNWAMETPAAAVKVIAALKDGGEFPGNDRYPVKLS